MFGVGELVRCIQNQAQEECLVKNGLYRIEAVSQDGTMVVTTASPGWLMMGRFKSAKDDPDYIYDDALEAQATYQNIIEGK